MDVIFLKADGFVCLNSSSKSWFLNLKSDWAQIIISGLQDSKADWI